MSILLLLAFLAAITPAIEAVCSDAMLTSLSSSGFTIFAHALHSQNITANATTAARVTCFVPPDDSLLGKVLGPTTLRAHVYTSGALPYQALLKLPLNTTLPAHNTRLVFGTDGRRVSFNDVLVTAPNLHVDDSCVVHGVEGPLVPMPPLTEDAPRTRTKNVASQALPKHRRRRFAEIVRLELMDNDFSPYDTTYVVAINGENLSSDATWYPCPFVNPISATSPLHGTAEGEYFPSCAWNEAELEEEAYEGKEPPYYDCGNWLREYQYSFGDCWRDGYVVDNGIYSNEDGAELNDREDSRQSEQHHESQLKHEEFAQEGHPASDLSNPWYDLWFACGGKTKSQDYIGQETRVTCPYDVPEISVFESLFGYWPCLYR
ncbi:hypothetical protein EV1_009617 [Malus domestica]